MATSISKIVIFGLKSNPEPIKNSHYLHCKQPLGAAYGLEELSTHISGANVTLNGERYRALINDFLIPEIEAHDLHNIRVQRNGTTCHTTRETIDLLRCRFGAQFIFHLESVDWPPRSGDITPSVLNLWSYLKSKFFVFKPASIEASQHY